MKNKTLDMIEKSRNLGEHEAVLELDGYHFFRFCFLNFSFPIFYNTYSYFNTLRYSGFQVPDPVKYFQPFVHSWLVYYAMFFPY